MSHRRLVVHVAVTAAWLSLASCASGPDAAGDVTPSGKELGLEHVHGLGVDPGDGTLYAATHFGLWRMPAQGEGEPARVADRYQDTMGFTVVGPGTFLGSGHPDFQKDPDLPTRLGLIRSQDAGETWQSVSLGGEADFHVLHAVHGRIYGWDAGSGRLMVSDDDGLTWDTRSTLNLRDLAVSPTEPDVLLATTEKGLVRSDDGGRTWARISGAPAPVVLAWAGAASLYAATPDGGLQHSADGGTTWTARGDVGGEPEALAVAVGDEEAVYVAVSEGGILSSSDGGVTFSVRYSDD